MTSAGVYPFPSGGTSSESVPPWVESPAGAVCVVLDGTLLRPVPSPSQAPVVEPSTQPELPELLQEVKGLRELLLYSIGAMIFLLAVVSFRSRKA